jgi:hypothetical protein
MVPLPPIKRQGIIDHLAQNEAVLAHSKRDKNKTFKSDVNRFGWGRS